MTDLVHLQIKVPATNEQEEKQMQSFLETVYRVLPRGGLMSLEIVSQDQFLTFYITVDRAHKDQIESQIYARFPDIEVSKTSDWTGQFAKDTVVSTMKFKHYSLTPVKTFHHVEENLLKNISALIQKNSSNERFFVQFVLKKVGSKPWHKGIRGMLFDLNGVKYAADGSPTPRFHKYTQGLYKGCLRIGFQSPNSSEAQVKLAAVMSFIDQMKGSNKLEKGKMMSTNTNSKLYDAIKARTTEVMDFWMPAEIATLYHFPYKTTGVSNVTSTTSKKAPPPDVLPTTSNSTPKETSFFGETNYRNSGTKFGIKRIDRRRHMYVIGKTGSGKSKFLELLLVSNLKDGDGCCLLDPHGDLSKELLGYIPKERIKDVIYIDPADREFPIAFNPLEYTDDYEKRQQISSFFISIFKKIFSADWNERMEHILRYIILALLETKDSNVLGITRILTDTTYRQRVVKEIQDPVIKAFWANEFSSWNEQFASQAIVPLLNKVGQFTANPIIRNMIGQNQNVLQFDKFMNEGKIVILNISKGKLGEENSSLLGSMIITKIQQAALSRASLPEDQRRDFFFYIDEFQNFATEAFDSILSEARKYRLNMTIAHQYIDQLPEEVKSTVFGNVGTVIAFSVGGTDAQYLEKEFSPVFTANDILSLEAREMCIKMLVDGKVARPFSARTLDVPPAENNYGPEVIEQTRKNYAQNRLAVEQYIAKWSSSANSSGMEMEAKSDYPEPII